MLVSNVQVDSLNKLQEYINYIALMNKMKTDEDFQLFIQQKCLEVVKKQSDLRIQNNTTDDEYITEYKSNHKIRKTILNKIFTKLNACGKIN